MGEGLSSTFPTMSTNSLDPCRLANRNTRKKNNCIQLEAPIQWAMHTPWNFNSDLIYVTITLKKIIIVLRKWKFLKCPSFTLFMWQHVNPIIIARDNWIARLCTPLIVNWNLWITLGKLASKVRAGNNYLPSSNRCMFMKLIALKCPSWQHLVHRLDITFSLLFRSRQL